MDLCFFIHVRKGKIVYEMNSHYNSLKSINTLLKHAVSFEGELLTSPKQLNNININDFNGTPTLEEFIDIIKIKITEKNLNDF